MTEKVTPIPEGFHTLTPHLVVKGAEQAIEFYQKALGAQLLGKHAGPGGKIIHALLQIGDSKLMLADEFPEFGSLGPQAGGTAVSIHVYVDDVNNAWERAVAAGAQVRMPLMDQFWGDRYGQVVDPFGHLWSLGSRVKIMTPEEMERAQAEAFAKAEKMKKSA
ncbi:MAG TPA: VOC family protein [Terriglobales bacterium]|nr:VOC family protein [Terriglobales bacterium]